MFSSIICYRPAKHILIYCCVRYISKLTQTRHCAAGKCNIYYYVTNSYTYRYTLSITTTKKKKPLPFSVWWDHHKHMCLIMPRWQFSINQNLLYYIIETSRWFRFRRFFIGRPNYEYKFIIRNFFFFFNVCNRFIRKYLNSERTFWETYKGLYRY